MSERRLVEVISGLGRGGAEIALARRFRLQPSDMTTRVLNTRRGLSELERAFPPGTVHLSTGSRMRGRRLWSDIAGDHPDLVIVHNPIEACVLLASRRRADPRIVVVAHAAMTSPNRTVARLLNVCMGRLNKRAAMHVAVSRSAAIGPQCRGAARVVTLSLGAEIDENASPLDLWRQGTKLRLLSLGRLTQQKNFDGLIRAVALSAVVLREAQAELVILGRGAEEASLIRQVTAAGLEDLVRILPAVADASGAYLAADWCIVASHNEGGPLTILEALLAGCRVLSTPVGLAVEALSGDPECLVTLDSDDPALARGLTRVVELGAPGESERMDRTRRSQRWNSTRSAAAFYAVITGLLDEPTSAK